MSMTQGIEPLVAKYEGSEQDKLALVQNMMDGVQLVAAAEVMHLASKFNLNSQEVFETVANSAGTSTMFKTRVPNMLNPGSKPSGRTLQDAYESLSASLQVARRPTFYFNAPIATAAEQVLLGAVGAGLGAKDDSDIWKFWQLFGGNDLSKKAQVSPNLADSLRAQGLPKPGKVAFIGMGSMGQGMATVLKDAGYKVVGYDSYAPCMESFKKAGGTCASSAKEAAQDADCIVFMPVLLSQCENCLFDEEAITTLKKDAVVVLCSTSAPTEVRKLGERIKKYSPSMDFVDAPVSGGAVRAAKGDLIIMASSNGEGPIKKVFSVLDAFASTIGNTSNLKILLAGGLGAGNSTKAIIQYLAGTHAVAGAEAIAFAARLGLDTEKAYKMLSQNGAGFIFENRLGRTVSNSTAVESKTDIMTKDLNIVVTESRTVQLPCFLPAIAHTVILQACSAGWIRLDDCCLINLWTKVNGNSAVGANHRKGALNF